MNYEKIPTEFAFACPQGSLLAKEMSLAMLKLKEVGVVGRILDKWVFTPKCSPQGDVEERRFDWYYFGGIITAMTCTVVLCIFIVLLENLYTKIKYFESSGST